jgi:putative transposase
MYDYRKMTLEERRQILDERRARGFPLHAPPHLRGIAGHYLITAACYEHRHIFSEPDALSELANDILGAFMTAELPCSAWVFLPNHYHVLLYTQDLTVVSEVLRLAHSRIATNINSRQHQKGRRVWYRFSDRLIRNEKHYWATVNYIHYNPVKHGYVERAENWAWSSLPDYIETCGKKQLGAIWKQYPIDGYGRGWDC